ncbi:hypothetical protein KDX14_28695 [Burkholderia cenocepacia]|uniref:hypothetical protein n=1 Tax=Burkholderia cenocepacia TaxID=95486 RepID=UPI001B9F8420|nr:hypothetical protein [Burkholderia cenocepacia]MBR8073511.1 hypothetical protein [Burkholderia cenocepacia]
MLTDVEVFAIRAAGLPENLRRSLYPELYPLPPLRTLDFFPPGTSWYRDELSEAAAAIVIKDARVGGAS